MSELALATSSPTPQAIAAKDRSAPLKVTGKLRIAIDAMVWQGARRDEAAQKASLTDHSLRSALRKPHVKAYYLGQLEVLRTSERARNIHTLAEVRDQNTNQMARVQAVKVLEQISDESNERGPVAPFSGVVVVIQPAPTAPQINEINTIDQE